MKIIILLLFFLRLSQGGQEHKLFPVEPGKAEAACGRYFVRGNMALYYRYDLGSATGWGKTERPAAGTISKREKPQVVVNRLVEPTVVKGAGRATIQLPDAKEAARVRACLRAIN